MMTVDDSVVAYLSFLRFLMEESANVSKPEDNPSSNRLARAQKTSTWLVHMDV